MRDPMTPRCADPPPRTAALRGLGPKSASMLADTGFASPEALRSADPFVVYARVKRAHPRASLNLLYALIGAVEDRDWREVARRERTTVLLRLDEMGLAPRRAASAG